MDSAKDPAKMLPISIDDAMSKPILEVDVFIKLSDVKFIMVGKGGTEPPAGHFEKFKAKNVRYLWVRSSDFAKVAQHSVTVAGLVVGHRQIADASKVAVLGDATQAVFKAAEACGFNETTFAQSKMVVEATTSLAASQPTLASLIEKIGAQQPGAARHAMSVSLVSTMIGVGHDWVKSATLEKLALGGMLHDIGKLTFPKDLLEKPRHMLNKDDTVIWKSHPELGRELLAQARNVPDDVVLMVLEHHERADGTGYPRGLKDFQISPLARVVALANEFVEIVDSLADRSARRALATIEATQVGQFNRDAVRALRRMIVSDSAKAA